MKGSISQHFTTALFGLGLLASSCVSAADLKFAVEPTYNQERAAEVYGPLLNYLNKATGHNFELVTARNYHFYWSDLRSRSDIDFAMEEAHFVDYRAQHFGYRPMVKTAEPSSYSLLAMDPLEGDALRGLVARRVVCMPAPNLGFAMLLEMYPNPMQQQLPGAMRWKSSLPERPMRRWCRPGCRTSTRIFIQSIRPGNSPVQPFRRRREWIQPSPRRSLMRCCGCTKMMRCTKCWWNWVSPNSLRHPPMSTPAPRRCSSRSTATATIQPHRADLPEPIRRSFGFASPGTETTPAAPRPLTRESRQPGCW